MRESLSLYCRAQWLINPSRFSGSVLRVQPWPIGSAEASFSRHSSNVRQYDDGKWECPRILDELDRTQELYFDRVSLIRMESWSRGRVVLVGDAAFCVSLVAGQGSALAMISAYVLAGELANAGGDTKRPLTNTKRCCDIISTPNREVPSDLLPPLHQRRHGACGFATR